MNIPCEEEYMGSVLLYGKMTVIRKWNTGEGSIEQ
jgi:hypothetical protein